MTASILPTCILFVLTQTRRDRDRPLVQFHLQAGIYHLFPHKQWRTIRGAGEPWPPMQKLGTRLSFTPPPPYLGCGPINIRHIFFLMFHGFCAHANTDRLAPPPPPEDSFLDLCTYHTILHLYSYHLPPASFPHSGKLQK